MSGSPQRMFVMKYAHIHYIITTLSQADIQVYQRCCRNFTIINLVNVNSTEQRIPAIHPDPSLQHITATCFQQFTSDFYLSGMHHLLMINQQTDPDGDSQAYELLHTLRWCGSIFNPQPNHPIHRHIICDLISTVFFVQMQRGTPLP